MGRAPAVVIIARHGARLDAADTQWHLTSPTPYDPPLTYGGWRQSQALGERIASIIQQREVDDLPAVNGNSGRTEGVREHRIPRGRRRKHRVVIHTSPFLRCIQTSIAISAGMEHYLGVTKPSSHKTDPKIHTMHSGSPHLRGIDRYRSHHLAAIPEPKSTRTPRQHAPQEGPKENSRTLLRVDAFLGEWLSPDYFDKITPPPESKMMVASAKADLLHRGDSVDLVHTANRHASVQGNLTGLWNGNSSAIASSTQHEDPSSLCDLSDISQAIPKLVRANSHSEVENPDKCSSLPLAIAGAKRSPAQESSGYVPPIPSYAVSPSQPIPQGYVAHARNACVEIDYQWDSLRPPLEWGNGGKYGEEWSAMHKRFRKGLNDMITWYKECDSTITLEPMDNESAQRSLPAAHDDDETDTVLVLVTHGAGCNALIGALTNQPVLIDVGMASLTMAAPKSIGYKRVPSPAGEVPISPSRRRHPIMDSGISEDYEVKITASTEHLRAGSPFLAGAQLSRTPSLPTREKSPYRYERPGFAAAARPSNSGATNGEGSRFETDGDTSTSGRFGELQRSVTVAAKTSAGLWSKPVPQMVTDAIDRDAENPSPQAGQNAHVRAADLDGAPEALSVEKPKHLNGAPMKNLSSVVMDSKRTKSTSENDNLGRSVASNGLWGAPPQALATERDQGSKRRWTLTQA